MALLLAACGGGGGDEAERAGELASSTAQGWAADAQAMPVATATTVQAATRTLESALAASPAALAAAAGRATALAARPLSLSLVLPCTGGGHVAARISGGSTASQLNGVLDAGERFELVFDACRSATGSARFDGALQIDVAAADAADLDVTHRAQALVFTDATGRYTLDGSVREQRRTSGLPAGRQRMASRLSSPGLALLARVDGRNSSHELRTLDWTVVLTVDAASALVERSHAGTLVLAVNTPRRPNATLAITTEGTLVATPGGLFATQGSFSVATQRDRIAVDYAGTQVQLSLDLGNDGSIDRRWTLPRSSFDGEAG
jgi:hypothetical protein